MRELRRGILQPYGQETLCTSSPLKCITFTYIKKKQEGKQNHHLLVHRLLTSDEHSDSSLFEHHCRCTGFFLRLFQRICSSVRAYNLWGSVVDQPQPSPPSSSVGADMGFRRPSQQGSSQQQQQQNGALSGEVEVDVAGGVGNSPSSASNGISIPKPHQVLPQEEEEEEEEEQATATTAVRGDR
ncbi:hypothetical protein PIB30_045029 [Stylosanthes scabra]|uniref:Uncharacterized protein n=1 Tax=Stylosanthes scabra TaxID=79078 RepID=A0ABU6RGD0_9FABA|nr:hypothetical protein [Stylosanthes scabra]